MKKLFLLSFLMVALMSCEEVIQLDLPNTDPLLVVNGRVTDSLGTEVQVFTSAPYYSNSIPGVSDAVVLLFENGVQVDSLTEMDTAVGYYVGTHKGIVGNDYHIEVTIQDNNPLYAAGTWMSESETLKRCPPVDSMYSEYREHAPFQPEGYYIAAEFKEIEGEGDFYRVRVWRNDSLQNEPNNLQFFSDEFFDGIDFSGPLAFTIDGPKPVGTTYVLELSSITERNNDYLAILQQQTVQVGSIFDPPPAAIIGNMYRKGDPSDYILGYFNASRLEFAEAVIIE